MQKQYSEKPFVNGLMRFEHVLCTVFNWICALILFVMMSAMVVQVLSRFVLKISVPWTDELSRYMWVSITYLGAGIALSTDSHVEISLVTALISGAKQEKTRRMWARIVDILRFAMMVVLSAFLTYYSWIYMFQVKQIHMVSAALQLPTWILDMMLTIGAISMLLHSLIRLVISIVDDSAIVDPACLGKEDEK